MSHGKKRSETCPNRNTLDQLVQHPKVSKLPCPQAMFKSSTISSQSDNQQAGQVQKVLQAQHVPATRLSEWQLSVIHIISHQMMINQVTSGHRHTRFATFMNNIYNI